MHSLRPSIEKMIEVHFESITASHVDTLFHLKDT